MTDSIQFYNQETDNIYPNIFLNTFQRRRRGFVVVGATSEAARRGIGWGWGFRRLRSLVFDWGPGQVRQVRKRKRHGNRLGVGTRLGGDAA